MATPDRWAVRECALATFYSLKPEDAGKALVSLSTLKTVGVETTGEIVYSRGGRGNAKLIGFSSNKESKVKLEDAIFDNTAVAMLTGNPVGSGAKEIDYSEILTVSASNTITLSKTPQGDLVSVYSLNANGTLNQIFSKVDENPTATQYTLTSKVLTFNTAVTAGSLIKVFYKVNTDASAKSVKVTSDAFGGTFRVVLDVLVVDEYTKEAYEGQLIIPNAKFQDSFSFNFNASGDPAVFTMNMDILKSPTSNDMWELVIFDEDLIN